MNPKGGNGSPRGNLREALTGTDPVPRWAWALAALLLLIPVFAVYKIVETRAALNTAEAGRQSGLKALANTEAALTTANKQLSNLNSAQAASDTELQAALQSRQKFEADVRSASTQLGEARQQLAAMETSFKDAQEKMRAGQAEVASTHSELQAATARAQRAEKELQAVTARAEKAEKQFAELANARAAMEAKNAALEKQIGEMNAALSEAQQRTSPVGSAATGSSGPERDATARPADVGAPVATGSLGAKSPGGNEGPAPQPGSIAVGKPKTPAEEVSSDADRARSRSDDPPGAKPPSSSVAVLDSGSPRSRARRNRSAPEVGSPRERASPVARRGRVTNLRQRREWRLSLLERRKFESGLPWRFAPTIRVDLEKWRREGLYAPYGPRFYRDRD